MKTIFLVLISLVCLSSCNYYSRSEVGTLEKLGKVNKIDDYTAIVYTSRKDSVIIYRESIIDDWSILDVP